jgi:UDPglucose 6-dehydrogenase
LKAASPQLQANSFQIKEDSSVQFPETFQCTSERQVSITVLGLGHIGLPTALGFADLGWNVIGADTDRAKVALIRDGKTPFFEPGLHELLLKHSTNPALTFTDDIESAIQKGTVIFLCVGTPQRESGEADLFAIEAIARTIAHNLDGYKLIVEKSTVPAVTGQWIRKVIQRHAPKACCAWDLTGANRFDGQGPEIFGVDLAETPVFDVASNPEFLQEGKAVADFFRPERIVCGVVSTIARDLLSQLYRPIQSPQLFTDVTTAELIKHAANAFLATKISFINMLADVCEAVDADVTKVALGLGLDSRIGPAFLNAGLGFGGYCLPKDLRAFIYLAEEHKVDCGLLRQTELINRNRVDRLVRKVREAIWIARGKTLALLGLAFKPETDDLRDAPSLRVIEKLQALGARLRVYDPKAMAAAQQILPEEAGKLIYCNDAYQACDGADAAVILTEWSEFRELDLIRLRAQMHTPIMIDGRNIYDATALKKAGFEYFSMGRGSTSKSTALASDVLRVMPTPSLLRPNSRPASFASAGDD